MNETTLLLLAEESVRLAWLGAVFLLLASLPDLWRALREVGLRRLLPWIGLTVLAVGSRLLVEPSFVHENRHGEMMYLWLLQSGHSLHGAGWFETYRLILAFGESMEAVFLTSAVLGGLSCLLAGLFSMVLLGAKPREGLLTGLILAMTPVHIRVSASESPLVLAAFLTIASSTAVAFGLREKRSTLVVAGFLLAVVLSQTRSIYMVFPAFLVALPFVLPRVNGKRPNLRLAVGGAALSFLLLIPRLCAIFLVAAEGDALFGLSIRNLANQLFSEANIALNPRLFPVALTVLGLAGFAFVAYRTPATAAWMGALLAILLCWFLSMNSNLGAIIRFQHSFLFLIAALAARGTFELLSLLKRAPHRLALSAGLLAAAVTTAIPGARIIGYPFDKDVELAWLKNEARAALPKKGVLVLPGYRAFHEGRILLYFVHEVLPDRGVGWTIVRQAPDAPLHPLILRTKEDVFYYRGLWAYEFVSGELPHRDPPTTREERYRANPFFDHERTSPGMAAWAGTEDSMIRPEITALESRLVLEPVEDLPPHTFEARPYHRWIVPQRKVTISFHRVVGADGVVLFGDPEEKPDGPPDSNGAERLSFDGE